MTWEANRVMEDRFESDLTDDKTPAETEHTGGGERQINSCRGAGAFSLLNGKLEVPIGNPVDNTQKSHHEFPAWE